jgi:hypothetical protein
VIIGGWMLFDGLHAVFSGDFVTPKSGTHAGRLGPWADVLSALGLDPRSMPVKVAFVAYAGACLAAGVAFAARVQGAWWAVLVLAVLGLWYVPFGTVVDLAVIALLLTPALRTTA